MKIAVLGGRFDPPHLGHFLIAQQVLDLKPDVEKVIFIPAYKHPWREIVASSNDRISMLKTSLSEGMELSTIDIDNKETYTVNTLNRLKEKYEDEIYWIVGTDIVNEFSRWKNPKELTKLATFLVFPRDPHVLPKEIPDGFEILGGNLITSSISSSMIRKRIKENKTIKYLVPEKIESYIKEHRLYE